MASDLSFKGNAKDYESLGPLRQARTKRLLKALLCGADPQLGEGLQAQLGSYRPEQLKLNEDGQHYTLAFEVKKSGRNCLSKLAELVDLTETELPKLGEDERKQYERRFNADRVTESLDYLKSYLGILTHVVERKRGEARYHFVINLWSGDIGQNLRQFDQLWQNRRGKSQRTPDDPELSLEDLVQSIREKIHADIQTRCGTMRVLDMEQPIELSDIYTHINILERLSGRQRLDMDDLLQDVDPENFDRFSLGRVRQERVLGIGAVERYAKLMVLGKPGAGKTTFLKRLATLCNLGKFEPQRVPVFVTLKVGC